MSKSTVFKAVNNLFLELERERVLILQRMSGAIQPLMQKKKKILMYQNSKNVKVLQTYS